jgi:acyl-CoA thioester hydrolase
MHAAAELADYRLTFELPVRFRDLDALGHVNNAVYLTYLEEARVEYLRRVLSQGKISDYDVVVARIEIDYKSAAMLGETLVIGIRVTRLGGASFDMDYKIVDKKTGRLVAQAKSVLVSFDHRLGKVKKLDEKFADKVKEYDRP